MPEKWKSTRDAQNVEIKEGDSEFCVFCTFVIRLTNNGKTDAKLRLTVLQLITQLNGQREIQKTFKSRLTINKPQPLRLERNEVTTLYFKQDDDISLIEVELLLGNAEIKLLRSSDTKVLMKFPDDGMALQQNFVTFNYTQFDLNTKLTQLPTSE